MAELVDATEKARQLIRELKAKHGELMFHQSGGCCDGSAPMCFEAGELMIDDSDVLLAEIEGCPFYMSAFQYKYWKYSHLTLDVVPGRGASFSLEIPLGVRFIIKSRLLTDEEAAQVKDA
ncbi:DUF779 domain-containing protein [Saprospira sp. CCB-QB6]|uniref:DUF779 domain-containing protein n=1 Tax=Saprospira sp. CCB-QB6 TaxID=3023936 RepID=UPI002349EA3B|nr:DUF779 domain-containing protein [Saprospira sp. CCB-QB6]WCL82861.1 DUF779 domain-containing protein [Saprospira sp. CCB-QB6]